MRWAALKRINLIRQQRKFGFGRRCAVISSARNSLIFNFPASSVGLFNSNRSFTCSHVHARGEGPLVSAFPAGPLAPGQPSPA